MTKAMTIAYEVDGGLYLNLTNRCSNRCEFCIRHNGDGAYGSDSLWLLREPTVDEVLEAVSKFDLVKYKEVVFCGYGEPSYRLYDCITVAKELKKRHEGLKVRINTNGHSSLILDTDTAPLYKDAFDTVSISLNTPTAQRYDEICHPVFKNSFEAILCFAKNVKNYVHSVLLSVVRQTLTESELSECKKIADECGVTLKIRELIS